jgi:hypothetical protein
MFITFSLLKRFVSQTCDRTPGHRGIAQHAVFLLQIALGLGLEAVKATRLVSLLDISGRVDSKKYEFDLTSKDSDWVANLRSRN